MSRDVYKDAAQMRNDWLWKFAIAPLVVVFWTVRLGWWAASALYRMAVKH